MCAAIPGVAQQVPHEPKGGATRSPVEVPPLACGRAVRGAPFRMVGTLANTPPPTDQPSARPAEPYPGRTDMTSLARPHSAADPRVPTAGRRARRAAPTRRRSLRRAAWAGLQDSMPRAALLSIHARVEGTEPSTWEDPSLVQLWGPRYSAYVVAARDLAVFSLGRLPDEAGARRIAEDLADRLHALLGGGRMTYGEAGHGARRKTQPAPIRRADRHGRDALGRRASADRLDGAGTRGRAAGGSPRARPPLPARLRSHDA